MNNMFSIRDEQFSHSNRFLSNTQFLLIPTSPKDDEIDGVNGITMLSISSLALETEVLIWRVHDDGIDVGFTFSTSSFFDGNCQEGAYIFYRENIPSPPSEVYVPLGITTLQRHMVKKSLTDKDKNNILIGSIFHRSLPPSLIFLSFSFLPPVSFFENNIKRNKKSVIFTPPPLFPVEMET